jgi:thiamine transport system permease protein
LILSLLTAAMGLLVALGGIWLDHRFRARSRLSSVISNFMVLPSGASTMVLGLGLFIAYRGWVDPFSSSYIPVVVLQAIFFVAIAFRVLRPVSIRFRESELEAAMTLGASPVRSFFEIEWPRWRGPLFGVFSLILGGALGEVGAVSLFYNEGRVPLPLLIFRWMGQYQFEKAQAVSLLLMILSTGLIALGTVYEPKA